MEESKEWRIDYFAPNSGHIYDFFSDEAEARAFGASVARLGWKCFLLRKNHGGGIFLYNVEEVLLA